MLQKSRAEQAVGEPSLPRAGRGEPCFDYAEARKRLNLFERSARVLATRFGFKTKKVFVKVVGQEVVSPGFHETSLSRYFHEAVVCNGIVTGVWMLGMLISNN